MTHSIIFNKMVKLLKGDAEKGRPPGFLPRGEKETIRKAWEKKAISRRELDQLFEMSKTMKKQGRKAKKKGKPKKKLTQFGEFIDEMLRDDSKVLKSYKKGQKGSVVPVKGGKKLAGTANSKKETRRLVQGPNKGHASPLPDNLPKDHVPSLLPKEFRVDTSDIGNAKAEKIMKEIMHRHNVEFGYSKRSRKARRRKLILRDASSMRPITDSKREAIMRDYRHVIERLSNRNAKKSDIMKKASDFGVKKRIRNQTEVDYEGVAEKEYAKQPISTSATDMFKDPEEIVSVAPASIKKQLAGLKKLPKKERRKKAIKIINNMKHRKRLAKKQKLFERSLEPVTTLLKAYGL